MIHHPLETCSYAHVFRKKGSKWQYFSWFRAQWVNLKGLPDSSTLSGGNGDRVVSYDETWAEPDANAQ